MKFIIPIALWLFFSSSALWASVGLGLRVSPYGQGIESLYSLSDELKLFAEYARKGEGKPDVDSIAFGLRKVFFPLFYEIGIAHTTSYLFGPAKNLEVRRGYLGARIAFGVFFDVERYFFSLRFAAFDAFVLKETIDESVYGPAASRSLPGRYGEIIALSAGYYFL